MCPQCDSKCDYWRLSETCLYSRLSNLFDNRFTGYFAIFMSLWGESLNFSFSFQTNLYFSATLYLELWKRYSANLVHNWGLTNYTNKTEPPRPQYLARIKNLNTNITKMNLETSVLEPAVPYWRFKFPRYVVSYTVIFLFVSSNPKSHKLFLVTPSFSFQIMLAIAAVFGIILYRMSLNTAQNIYGNTDSMTYKITVLPVTAAVINLIVITLLNFVYDYLAIFLTDLEIRRTQAEYDESLSLKIYLFQFVNYYSSIFYIAFLKGKFVGYPAKHNRILGFRQEECSPGGCMMELCIQLVIIMIGKQIMNSVLEMLMPLLIKTLTGVWNRIGLTSSVEDDTETIKTHNQWTEDYKLLPWQFMSMFNEYLEMVIQYGFITIFVVAFPLAPFFALINNIFEMRLDAKKFLLYYRRSVPKRVRDIGSWYRIMQIICRLSVMSNAFIIAFSSNLIPEMVYNFYLRKEMIQSGYLNFTLAKFDVTDFEKGPPNNSSHDDVGVCYYTEFRNPPEVEPKYKKSLVYWHVLAARLAFIVVFQNLVGLVQLFVDWAIPDVPRRVRERVKREDYLLSSIILDQEKRKFRRNVGGKMVDAASKLLNEKGLRKRVHKPDNHVVEFQSKEAGSDVDEYT